MTSKQPSAPDLSVAIICKNNESTIGRTLDSVRTLAGEIVAVDSGSTDSTVPMLESAGAIVERSPWLGYIQTKNLALSRCSRKWVLCLDSDESIDDTAANAIAEIVNSDSDRVAGARMNRKVYYKERPLNHAWQPEWRVRLVRRAGAKWAGLDPHDVLEPKPGDVATLPGTIRHDSISTFADFFEKQARHGRVMAQSMFAEGRRGSVYKLVTSPVGAFAKQVVFKRAFLDGWPGWLAAAATASGSLAKHAALIELSRSSPTRP